jgi:hypothetical protein
LELLIEMQMAGHNAAKNALTADLKPCYAPITGRVGWRGVEKIFLAVIGSAHH